MTGATSVGRQAEVAEYAAAVRAALTDVPADRCEELLEDLEDHLAEVAADGDAPLEFRLGSPRHYADELRAAAGLPAAPPAEDEQVGLTELLARLRSWAPVRQVEAFLPELRPAWWVVRAWAAVTAVDVVFVGGTSFPVPTLGLGPVGLLVTGAAIAWSVRLGLQARAEGREPGHRAALVNAGLGLLTLVALVGVAHGPGVATAEQVYVEDAQPDHLVHEDGTPITNILPFSSTGEPLTGVLLYDQDGRPIDGLADATVDGAQVETVPDAPLQPGNAYPQQRQVRDWDEYGQETVVPMPLPSVAPTTGATPEPEPAPSVPGETPATVPGAPPTQ